MPAREKAHRLLCSADCPLLLLLVLSICPRPASCVPQPGCLTPPDDLIGWWAADGDAQDLAGSDNGAMQGGVTANAPGMVGSAFSFDGTNGYVQAPDSASLNPANFTIAAWVRFSSLESAGSGASPAGQQYIVFKQNSRSGNFEGYELGKTRIASGDIFSFIVSSASGQSVALQSQTMVATGIWYHVAAVRGSNFLQLYVNGQLEGQTNVSFPQDYGSLPLYFGTSGQSYWDHKFKGLLDEVSLYNRALASSEIAAEYGAGGAGKCKDPRILAQPQDATRYWGSSMTFTSAATGAQPLRFQWQKDGLTLAGATNSSLVLTNLQITNSGRYSLIVSNAFGVTSSSPAFLIVKVADLSLSLTATSTQNMAALKIAGLAGQAYRIEFSPKMSASNLWINLTNLILSAPTNICYDPEPAVEPQRFYRVVAAPNSSPLPRPAPWETDDIGAVWSDDFNRASLGPNWIILGGANVSVAGDELFFNQTDVNLSRQLYYQPWLTSSDSWTIRWTERFDTLDANSRGVGVGLKNFQAQGGNDRGYNGLLGGVGNNLGRMQLQRFDGNQQILVASGPAIGLTAGDKVDCSLTRSGWTITATASNRANAQLSTTSIVFSDAANLIAPTISRICFYPLSGRVYADNISFTINYRKPARFVVIGGSSSEGYNASAFSKRYIAVIQSNYTEAVCNDSSSYNSTSNSVSILPEILAHQPGTAILMIGGNDLLYGYPASQWKNQYSNLVAQLQLSGAQIKHCLPTPRSNVDLTPLKNWILSAYPATNVIDTWTPLLQGSYSLKSAYDSGDGVHPNDAGHLLIGQIIRTNLP